MYWWIHDTNRIFLIDFTYFLIFYLLSEYKRFDGFCNIEKYFKKFLNGTTVKDNKENNENCLVA